MGPENERHAEEMDRFRGYLGMLARLQVSPRMRQKIDGSSASSLPNLNRRRPESQSLGVRTWQANISPRTAHTFAKNCVWGSRGLNRSLEAGDPDNR
jgi:hypothetical protein